MLRRLFLLFLAAIVFMTPCGAEPLLKVGYVKSPGYFTQNENGDYAGAIYENLEKSLAYTGYSVSYREIAPEDAERALLDGEIDVFAGFMVRREYGTENLEPIGWFIAPTTVYLARPYTGGLTEGRTRVGYYAPVYSLMLDFLRDHPDDAERGILEEFEFVPYDDMELLHQEYRSGGIGGYITSSFMFDDTAPVERILFPSNVFMMVKRGRTDVKEAVSAGMRQALLIDSGFRSESLHFEDGVPLVLSREEREYLRAHPVIVAVSSGDQPPLTAFEGDDSKGIIRDILDIAEADLGVRFEMKRAKNNAKMMEMLADGQVDVVTHFNANHNRAGEHKANITDSYLTFEYVPVRRRYGKFPDSPRVACPRKHFFVQNYVTQHYPAEQIRWYNNFSECFEAVSRGEADLMFAKSLTVYQDLADYHDLYTSGHGVATSRMAMAVSEHEGPLLLSILNKEIAHIGDAKIQQIVQKYMNQTAEAKSWKTYVYENPVGVLAGVLAVAAVVIGVLAYISNMRKKNSLQLFDAAYQNPFTRTRTMSWMEKFVPSLLRKRHKKDLLAGKLFLLNLSIYRFDLLRAAYDQNVLFTGIKKLIGEMRAQNDWILYDSISSELAQMFFVCRKPEGMTPFEAVEKLIEDASEIDGDNASIRMSYRAGLCQIPAEIPVDMPTLITNAAVARNEAVQHGETIGVYDGELQERRVLEKKIEDLMGKALENEEFEVWLQPKYDIRTHKVIGAESLVRWQSPELGFLMPFRFIELFEKNGFIIPFDYYMLEHVCQLQRKFLAEGRKIVPIAVNLSGLHMREAGFVERMREIKEASGLPDGAVELELTETAFIDYDTKEESTSATAIVGALREMGYAIAMDDFCTGYSSIAMLQRLPMDVMKIDRSMLLASEKSARGQKILKNVVNFGRSLDMLVLCEGIETEEQEKLLLENGCTYGQGFLFSRPMHNEKYVEFIEEHDCA